MIPSVPVVLARKAGSAQGKIEDRQDDLAGKIGSVTTNYQARRRFQIALSALLLPLSALCASAPATLDDLKKLEIICFVPSYLPAGFRLEGVEITYDEIQEYEDKNRPLPLYSLEYGNGGKATFTIESAREGIGDRNLLGTEDADETEIESPFGPMYLIYTPKGKRGRKVEIKTNWASDANMKAEKAKDQLEHPVLGRYHGFSATGITVTEFTKIIKSLHPINGRS